MPANPHRGQVEIELGGELYLARLTMNNICELEAKLKMPFSAFVDGDNLRLDVIRHILWIACRNYARKLTLEQVGDVLRMDEFEYYGEKIGELFRLGLGVKEGETSNAKENPTQPADASG